MSFLDKINYMFQIVADYTVSDTMIEWAVEDGATGTIEMDPKAFLILTLPKEWQGSSLAEQLKAIKQGSLTYDQYEDFGQKNKIQIMPFLTFNYKSGKVEGHEGRHRAFAAWKEGKKTITVALKPRPKYGANWDTTFPKNLYSQFSSSSIQLTPYLKNFKPFDRIHRTYKVAASS